MLSLACLAEPLHGSNTYANICIQGFLYWKSKSTYEAGKFQIFPSNTIFVKYEADVIKLKVEPI